MKNLKLAVTVLGVLACTGLVSAAQPEQSHNLSEIDPVDTDFNMSDYGIFNLSHVELRNGLNFSGYSVFDQGGVEILSYDTANSEWDFLNSDIDLNGNALSDSTGNLTLEGGVELQNGNLNMNSNNITNMDTLNPEGTDLSTGSYLDINSPVNTGAALDVGGAIRADGGIDSYSGLNMHSNAITNVDWANSDNPDTNASSACASGEYLSGDGTCDSISGADGYIGNSRDHTAGGNLNMSGYNVTSNGGEICAGNQC